MLVREEVVEDEERRDSRVSLKFDDDIETARSKSAVFEEEEDEGTIFDRKLGNHDFCDDEQLGSFHHAAEDFDDMEIPPHRFLFVGAFSFS